MHVHVWALVLANGMPVVDAYFVDHSSSLSFMV